MNSQQYFSRISQRSLIKILFVSVESVRTEGSNGITGGKRIRSFIVEVASAELCLRKTGNHAVGFAKGEGQANSSWNCSIAWFKKIRKYM